jgi:hypothetical protein
MTERVWAAPTGWRNTVLSFSGATRFGSDK